MFPRFNLSAGGVAPRGRASVAGATPAAASGGEASPDAADARAILGEPTPHAAAEAIPGTEGTSEGGPARSAPDDALVVEMVDRILRDAVDCRASDIHLEPLEHRFRVRLRIDGRLREAGAPPREWQLPMISRLKIMAGLSIAEKRLPQDGRMPFSHRGRMLDCRVSTVPTVHGESMVLRLLENDEARPGLEALGLDAADAALLRRLIHLPDGIVLATGPTGCGKTTTLHACLQALNGRDRKIITVEDPVEYQLPRINQVPVRPEAGMTFAAALRAMLRQAPNVIMVGEIRDRATAEMAVHAALTGHLVLSTLHTPDAVSAVTRLVDLGINPLLVAAALRASIAQRLIRRVCSQCAQPVTLAQEDIAALGAAGLQREPGSFRRGAGCAACRGSGYRGRIGVFEIFLNEAEIQELIHSCSGAAELRKRARAAGRRTLREDGLRKAIAGLTTVEEAVSLTLDDGGS